MGGEEGKRRQGDPSQVFSVFIVVTIAPSQAVTHDIFNLHRCPSCIYIGGNVRQGSSECVTTEMAAAHSYFTLHCRLSAIAFGPDAKCVCRCNMPIKIGKHLRTPVQSGLQNSGSPRDAMADQGGQTNSAYVRNRWQLPLFATASH